MTTFPLAWGQQRFGGYTPSEDFVVIQGRDRSPVGAVPMLWCHGFAGTDLDALRSDHFDDLAPIAALGHPILAGDFGGTTHWSNDAAIAAAEAALAWAGANLGTRTDRVALGGESMGSTLALNLAWRNTTRAAAVWIRGPITALAAFHDRNAAFAGAIEAAYGGLAGYQTALPTHDPAANLTALRSIGPRVRAWYTTGDELIPPTEVEAFAAATGARIDAMPGNHAAAVNTPPDVVAAWLARTIATNS